MSDLDTKLTKILYKAGAYKAEPWIAELKQAFADENPPRVTDATLYPLVWAKANGYKTGQEWYDRFEKELYKPPKQELPTSSNDDGESHDRFFRVGGQNFMYDRAIEAAKRAAGLGEQLDSSRDTESRPPVSANGRGINF